MSELTDAEVQKLFKEAAGAIRENDTSKLDSLFTEEEAGTPVEVETHEETPEVETPENEENTPQETPAEETTTEQDDTTTNEPDPLVDLRKQLEKLSAENHSLRSQAGRVPHVQRKLQEIDEKLKELDKRSTSPSNRPSATIAPKINDALKSISETDPELAKTIADAISQAADGVVDDTTNRERENLTLSRERALKDYRDEQINVLLDQYPNAPEVFKSPQWKEWKTTQSARMQDLAASDTADDVIFAFEKFAADMKKQYPELDTSPAPAVANEQAEKIEAERLRKKTTGVTTSSPAASSKVKLPDDPEALFKLYSDTIRKERLGIN